MVQGLITDTLLKLVEDPVPNIRFNVAKSAQLLAPKLSQKNKEQISKQLATLKDNDVDYDVRYFAAKALESLK